MFTSRDFHFDETAIGGGRCVQCESMGNAAEPCVEGNDVIEGYAVHEECMPHQSSVREYDARVEL